MTKTLHPVPLYKKPVQHSDNRNMALISNCSEMRTLFVDNHAPLDVSRDAAGYQIRAVTQVLESPSMGGSIECDSMILGNFALLYAIPVGEKFDVPDVLGKRLRVRSTE